MAPSLITTPQLTRNSKLYEQKPVNRHIHRATYNSHKKQRTQHIKVIWDCLTSTVQQQRHWKRRMTVNEESEVCRRKWSWPTWWYLAFAEWTELTKGYCLKYADPCLWIPLLHKCEAGVPTANWWHLVNIKMKHTNTLQYKSTVLTI